MTDIQYNFNNIIIDECVEDSFNEFLNDNEIQYPNLSNKKLEKWKFEEYLDKKKILPLNLEKEPGIIDLIPNLSNNSQNNDNQLKLVKFFGTIRNACENQLYISAKYDSNNKKYFPNKFFENKSYKMDLEDDNSINGSSITILSDRLELELVPVIGINEYFDNKYDFEGKNKIKIIVYDYSNKYTKINQNILVIGVSYESDNMIFIHSWKILGNYEKFKICREYNLLSDLNGNKTLYREKLKKILSKALKNDQ